MKPGRIALTGFMGAGKTSCGRLLAARLGWRFCDVDEVIEDEAGMQITEIFAQLGEAEFRKRESATIARLLQENGLVLALGGGAIESTETRALLKSEGTMLVHLEVSFGIAMQRCAGSEGTRPVFADKENLTARYNRRLPLNREAGLTIQVDKLTPEQVVARALEGMDALE